MQYSVKAVYLKSTKDTVQKGTKGTLKSTFVSLKHVYGNGIFLGVISVQIPIKH